MAEQINIQIFEYDQSVERLWFFICHWALGMVEPCGWGLGCKSGSAVLVAPEESLHKLQMEELRSGVLCWEVCDPYMFLGFWTKIKDNEQRF